MNRRLQQITDGLRGRLWLPPEHATHYAQLSAAARTTALALLETEREGAPFDHPEGARYIQISDTLAKAMGETLMRNLNARSG
jgi:hypothetical protein